MTHEVARADAALARRTCAAPRRLPGESLPEDVDTNAPLVAARARPRRAAARTAASRRVADARRALRLRGRAGTAVPRRRHEPRRARATAAAQRLELDVAPGVDAGRRARCCPTGWGDDAPGVLVALDEGGKARGARIGPAVARRPAARLGGARARPARHGRERGRASSSSRRPPGCSTATCSRAASTTCWPAVQWLSERYSTGQQIDAGASPCGAPGRSAWSRCSPRCSTSASPAPRAARSPRASRSCSSRAPRITPMAFPFARARAFDLADLVRLGRPRPLHAGGAARDAGGAGRRRPARRASRADGGTDPRARRRHLELRAGRRPAHHPPGRDRGRRARAGRRHGPARRRPRRSCCRCSTRLGLERRRPASRTPTADHLGGTAELLGGTPGCARPRRRRSTSPLVGDPERADPRALRALRRARRHAVRRRRRPSARAAAVGPAFGRRRGRARRRTTLDLGGRTAELRPDARATAPGTPSPGSPTRGLLAAGDAVMGDGIPTRDGNAADPADVRAAGRLPRDDRAARAPARRCLLATGHEPMLDAAGAIGASSTRAAPPATASGALVARARCDDAPRRCSSSASACTRRYGGLPATAWPTSR